MNGLFELHIEGYKSEVFFTCSYNIYIYVLVFVDIIFIHKQTIVHIPTAAK